MDKLRLTRVPGANAILNAIAQRGRRLFYCARTNQVSHFVVDPKNSQVWLNDAAGARVYTSSPHQWLGFTEGKELRPLIEALRDYIRYGTPVDAALLGFAGKDPWRYGPEALGEVHEALLDLPDIEQVLAFSVEQVSC